MRTIWQSLAWKEWHEHKWKLAALVAIMWGCAIYPLIVMDEGTLLGIRAALPIGIVPLAIFVGLGTAAGERSRGTMQFLQALPVPMWRVALNKLSFGLVTIILPALLTLALAYAWRECLDWFGVEYRAASDLRLEDVDPNVPFPLGTNSWFLDSALIAALVSTSFYVWTIALGVNRKDEVSAGAVALSAIVGWGVFLALVWNLILFSSTWLSAAMREDAQLKRLAIAGLSTAPGGLAVVTEIVRGNTQLLLVGLSVAAVTHLALANWFVRRFGRISNLEVRSPKTAEIAARGSDWLGPPRRSPITAIAWKQFWESGPIVLAGLAIVVGTTLLFWFPIHRDMEPNLGEVLSDVSMSLGLGLAMVVGIGVLLHDVTPGINTFWRSRPINADLWFWTKFLSGLAILLAAVYGPMFLLAFAGDHSALNFVSHPDTHVWVAIHCTTFGAAVAMTALVRHAVYAAILSIAATYLGVVTVGLALVAASLLGWAQRPREYAFDLTNNEAAVGLAISFVVCTIVAWLAVRNDWGQKAIR